MKVTQFLGMDALAKPSLVPKAKRIPQRDAGLQVRVVELEQLGCSISEGQKWWTQGAQPQQPGARAERRRQPSPQLPGPLQRKVLLILGADPPSRLILLGNTLPTT